MNESYIRCPECGELSPQDTQGWACQKCMGVEVEDQKAKAEEELSYVS